MSFRRIDACLVVEEKDAERVIESMLQCIDALVVQHVRIFDSDVTSETTLQASDVDEIRNEMP